MRDTNKFHIFFIFSNLFSPFPLPCWSNDFQVENMQADGSQLWNCAIFLLAVCRSIRSCSKPEIVSLWYVFFLVLVDCAACLDKCGLHVLCRKAHDSKTNRWHAVRNSSGCPALVWLLCRSCSTDSSTEENSNAQNSRVAVTPLILTTMYNCANPTLTRTSCKHRSCSVRAVIRIIRKSTSCGRGRDSRTTLRHRR